VRTAAAILAVYISSVGASVGIPETECQQSQIVGSSIRAQSSQIDRASVELSARLGDRASQVVLGMLLGEDGIPWLERAAEQGSIFAVKLLHIHFASKGVLAKDPEAREGFQRLAVHWAQEGVRRDDMDMQRWLGDYFFGGRGLPKDQAAAFQWWRKAAEKGSLLAQSSLSKALFEGPSTELNYVEALKWGLLVQQRSPSASFASAHIAHLPALKKRMSNPEIALSEDTARDWLSTFQVRETAKHNANERECGIREFDKALVH